MRLTEHEQLREALAHISYPAGIISCGGALRREGIPIPFDGYCAIGGRSFFPGGKGHVSDRLPTRGIMYLGQDFGKYSDFVSAVRRGREDDTSATWRGINEGVVNHLDEGVIWFTNYYMGIRDGGSSVGSLKDFVKEKYSTDSWDSVGEKCWNSYEEFCWEFFKLQVSLQRPKVVVALGRQVIDSLGAHLPQMLPEWRIRKSSTFGHLRGIAHQVEFETQGKPPRIKVIAAYHPMYFSGDPRKLAKIEDDAQFVRDQFGNPNTA